MDETNYTQEKSCCASLEERVRENPTRAIFTAFGIGLAIALIVRALEPKPRSHVKQILEDIHERLHELADPAMERLNDFADQGSAVLKKGASHMNDIHENLRSVGCKLKSLFR